MTNEQKNQQEFFREEKTQIFHKHTTTLLLTVINILINVINEVTES